MKRLSLALVAVLALAGCGGSHRRAVVAPVRACDVNDYAMQCALTAPSQRLLGVAPTVQGIDFGWSDISASAAKADGFRFGASYLSSDASKNWTRSLAAAYRSAGLATVNVWETSATRALSGFGAGQADARVALGQSLALGSGYRPIYFAIDFDETVSQAGAVAQYFRGVHSVLDFAGPVSFPTPVGVGAYGGYWPIKRLFDAHLISYGWQTYAWSGGLWDRRAQLQQYLNGSTFDHDRAVAADYGQTPYNPTPTYPVCFTRRIPAKTCAQVRAKVASQRRAAASSSRALAATRRALARNHCGTPPPRWRYSGRRFWRYSTPYRQGVCVHKRHDAAVFAQRARWFAAAARRLQAAN